MHSDNFIYNPVSTSTLLVTLISSMDFKTLLLDRYSFLLYVLAPGIVPKYVITVDEDLNSIPIEVRVGQTVKLMVFQLGRYCWTSW